MKAKTLPALITQNKNRGRKTIQQWSGALQTAQRDDKPRRGQLYDLYDDLLLDAHLCAELQRRTLSVKKSNYVLMDQRGAQDHDKRSLIAKPWFYKFLDYAIESRYWGHSLIQLGDIDKNGRILNIALVDRRHVVPEQGLFLVRPTDEKGVYYREDKAYSRWLLEVGEPKDLGLLNKIVPNVLYKRFAQAAWSEFCEIFGMPLRYGKTNVKDRESIDRMEKMMLDMATAAWAVIDESETIEFVETAKSNGGVYDALIGRMNAEISKLINGAVIGEDSQGGSRSKEEVGERTGHLIYEAEKKGLESFINETLFPQLIQMGYPFAGCQFAWEKSKDLGQLWHITQGLLPHYDVEEAFIADTFGVPVKAKTQAPAEDVRQQHTETDFFS